MKKIIASILFSSFCISAISAPVTANAVAEQPVLVNAYDASIQPYTIYLQPERTYVSAEELAQGDVRIHTNAYIQGDASVAMRSFTISYKADPDAIYFDSSMDLNDWQENEVTYTYSGGFFKTDYYPYCFGKVSGTGRYSQNGGSFTTGKALIEPKGGEVIYSDGNGGIYFQRSYRINEIDPETGEKKWIEKERVSIPADQIQPIGNGRAIFSYTYYLQDSSLGYPLMENTFEIPYYDPTLSAGEQLKGDNDVCFWMTGISNTNGSDFLGYTDEFPCFSFDIVLRQGTPNGTYAVELNDDICRLRNVDRNLVPLQTVNTAITVGAVSATVTEDHTSPYYCFYAENDKDIRLNQNNGSLLSQITYDDGTQENDALEAVVTCGQSPASLYANQNDTACITDVPFYLEDQPLQNDDGSDYTKTVLIGKKGDANLDGIVNVEDAIQILQYYAKQAAGLHPVMNDAFTEEENILSYFLSDIDTGSQNMGQDGGQISVEDAVDILTYYAQTSAGLNPTWNNR